MSTQLPSFIPSELRQLARFIPRRGWDVIDWKPMLSSLRTVSLRYLANRGVGKLAEKTADYVEPVQIVKSLSQETPLAELTRPAQLRRAGDELLNLYFAQWLVPEGMFIDLRIARFGVLDKTLHYAPNGLWIKLRPEFREGMLALYRSFYSSDDGAFDAALRQMGMLRDGLSSDAESELKELLYQHFGIEQSAQSFSIDAFKASFDQLFEFFTEHDYRLHSDFVWVGFYLITLYLTLEQGGQAHDTRSICARVLLE